MCIKPKNIFEKSLEYVKRKFSFTVHNCRIKITFVKKNYITFKFIVENFLEKFIVENMYIHVEFKVKISRIICKSLEYNCSITITFVQNTVNITVVLKKKITVLL